MDKSSLYSNHVKVWENDTTVPTNTATLYVLIITIKQKKKKRPTDQPTKAVIQLLPCMQNDMTVGTFTLLKTLPFPLMIQGYPSKSQLFFLCCLEQQENDNLPPPISFNKINVV